MKMNNKSSKRNYNSKLKSSVVLIVKPCFFAFCATLLPVHLLTSLTGVACAKSATEIGQELSQSRFAVPRDPNDSYARQLWRAEISVAKGQNNQTSKNKLKRMIEQIRSVEFKSSKQAPEPLVVPKETAAVEPNETSSDIPEQKEEKNKQIEPELPYEPITDQTLQMLRNLAQNPEKLDNPFELGEILFLCGNLKEAAMFYQEALKRKDPNNIGSARDRAWILFQIGNCRWNDDLTVAAKMYRQLITEYPDSPWTDLARAQSQLIDWFHRDEPFKLIAEREYAPSE